MDSQVVLSWEKELKHDSEAADSTVAVASQQHMVQADPGAGMQGDEPWAMFVECLNGYIQDYHYTQQNTQKTGGSASGCLKNKN